MSFKSPDRTWKHVLIWLALIALLLACGFVAVWFVWLENSRERVRAAQQALRDAGAPMTVEELRGPPVADEDNAFLVIEPYIHDFKSSAVNQELAKYDDWAKYKNGDTKALGPWNQLTEDERGRVTQTVPVCSLVWMS